jgi:four helix bundle protein
MEMGDSFKDLIAWQRSIQLSVAIYKLTAGFPKEETYGLSSQMRRAAVSVASNIAEGYARSSTGEYKQFLGMARGSNSEVQTQLIIAREPGYGSSAMLDTAEGAVKRGGQIDSGNLTRPLKRRFPLFLIPNP